jgi:hypothetical protein
LYKYAVWKFGATTGKQIGVEFLTGYVVPDDVFRETPNQART